MPLVAQASHRSARADDFLDEGWMSQRADPATSTRQPGPAVDRLAGPGQKTPINDPDPETAQRLHAAVKAWRQEMFGGKGKLAGNAVDPRPISVGYREFPITMLPARDGDRHERAEEQAGPVSHSHRRLPTSFRRCHPRSRLPNLDRENFAGSKLNNWRKHGIL